MAARLPCRLGTLALCALVAVTGCGGGGDSPQSQSSTVPPSGYLLTWDPPNSYADNTALNPYVDLDVYELYLRPDEQFSEADQPVASFPVVSDNGALVREFDLDLLNVLPNPPAGARLYVSLRAVGVDNQKSAFAVPVLWERI